MNTKIIGDVSIDGNVVINGDNSVRTVNSVDSDKNGNINIPMYSTAQVDKIISTLPVTRVGTMDYLPLNINGSFEGATNYINKCIYPIVIENDGTLVYLRPGTNGNTYGYYYCYVKSARDAVSLKPILTNEKYVPNNFTPNHRLDSFVGSNAGEVIMMRTNNGTSDTYTISLTNGTLNAESHQSVEFPRTLISGTDPQYVLVSNNVVYIFCLDGYSLSSEFAISLYTITVPNVISGVYTSLAKVTGFSGSNLFGDSVSASPNIKLAPKLFSTNPAEKSFYCIPAGNAYTNFVPYWGNADGSLHAEKSGSNIRVAFLHSAYAVTISDLSIDYTGISLVYNTTNKSYTFDNTNKGQCTITTTAQGVITWNNPYHTNSLKYFGLDYTAMGGGRCPTVFTTKDGIQFTSISSSTDEAVHRLSRAKLANFTSAYDAWNFNTYNTQSMNLYTISPIFGSAIGENMISPTIVSATKIMMKCIGTVNGVTTNLDTTAYTSLGASRNFVYNSINSGSTITGYAPNVDRGVLTNNDYRYNGCITIVNQNGSTEVYGSSFFEGLTQKFSGLLMDQNTLTYSQSVTIDNNVLSTLKTNILNGVTLPYSVKDSKIILYYVPNSSYTKSFAVTTVMDNAPTGSANLHYILSEVVVTINGNNITSVAPMTNYLMSVNVYATALSYNMVLRQSGLIISRYNDFTYVGMAAIVCSSIVGSVYYNSILCKVDNSTKSVYGTPRTVRSVWISNADNTYDVGAIPNVGFGLFENGPITDLRTKLIFRNYGTTEAQFDALMANLEAPPIEKIVIASQDVPQGYSIYFTQEVPVFLTGKFFKLPPQTINLQDLFATVQNKTFYLYVSIINSVPQYQITDVLQTEDLFRVYIGTIVTDAAGISSIVSEKVTRFLTYRVSTTKRGSAIPTSSGVPSSTGSRWH